MDCLIDYIGINACADQDAPDSGIYINSLPGISLESIEKIATQDQETYLGVWKDVQAQAQIRFKTDFIAQLTKCFEISKKCDYESMICDNKEILVTAWMYLLGNQLMLFRRYTNRLNKYTTVDLKKAEELTDYYMVEYEAALAQSVQLVDRSECMCLEPGGRISKAWMAP